MKSSEIKSEGSSILNMKNSGSAPETSSVSESICEPAYKLAFLQESSRDFAESHGKSMAFWKDGGKGLKKRLRSCLIPKVKLDLERMQKAKQRSCQKEADQSFGCSRKKGKFGAEKGK